MPEDSLRAVCNTWLGFVAPGQAPTRTVSSDRPQRREVAPLAGGVPRLEPRPPRAPIVQYEAPPTDRGHPDRVAARRRRAAKFGVGVACAVALMLLVASRLNPLMTSAANNRLAGPCADPEVAEVIGFDRTAWTPLLWSCTVRHTNGETETVRPW